MVFNVVQPVLCSSHEGVWYGPKAKRLLPYCIRKHMLTYARSIGYAHRVLSRLASVVSNASGIYVWFFFGDALWESLLGGPGDLVSRL